MSEVIIHYEGDRDRSWDPPTNGIQDTENRSYYPYIPDAGLVEAVNIAIDLRRPLLIEGEPGCGKTRLAGAVAYELTQKMRQNGKDENFWWPYYTWNIKSTSRVRDGLYRYDAVNRLRDTQVVGADPERLQGFLDASDAEKFDRLRSEIKQVITRLMDWENAYFQLGPLGKALQPNSEYRPILLVDEIDKADTDFPNDLLLELDELRFEIPELGRSIASPKEGQEPIIILTSNREKPLPDPFLRRCIYYYLEFPKEELLRQIIEHRFQQTEHYNELINAAVERFYEVRSILDPQPGCRPPGTSEFIDFLKVVLQKANKTSITDTQRTLDDLANHLPLLGLLLKTKADQELCCDAL